MAYCTTDDLAELGYTIADNDKANATLICDTASRLIDAYCKQTFTATTGFSESGSVYVKDGVVKYFPKNLTITNVDTMTFKPINGQPLPYNIQNFEYDDGYIIGYTNAPYGRYRVTVSYDFGFTAFPTDLVRATVLACAPLLDDYFLSQDANVSMVTSIKQGHLSIRRADTTVLPQNVLDILNGGNNGLGYVRLRASS